MEVLPFFRVSNRANRKKKKNAEKPRPNLGWISQAFRSPFFAMMGCVSWLQGNRGETWFRAPVPFPKCKGTWISQYATSGSLNDFKCRLYWESNLGHIKRPWRYWTFLRESQSSKRFHLLESFGGTKLETLLTSHFQGHARDCVRKSLKCLKYTSLMNYNLTCFPVPCQNASHHQAIIYI